MIPKCTSWLGHKFKARYSTGPANPNAYDGYQGDAVALIELAKTSQTVTYERDICVRCGITVEKKP